MSAPGSAGAPQDAPVAKGASSDKGAASVKGASAPASSFASAFSAIKDSSVYEAARELPSAPPGPPGPPGPAPPRPARPPSKNAVVVSSRQRGNPLLKHVRDVPWEYGEVVPDYVMGAGTCAVFLSVRYHRLNPQYIHDRLKLLGRQYVLRVLLVQVDVADPHAELQSLSRMCVLADLTMLLAWSAEEAARAIEVYKMFEHKPPDLIKEPRPQATPSLRVIEAVCSVHRISRPDAMTLLVNFGSLEGLVGASREQLAAVPGVGPLKAAKLYDTLHLPFRRGA